MWEYRRVRYAVLVLLAACSKTPPQGAKDAGIEKDADVGIDAASIDASAGPDADGPTDADAGIDAVTSLDAADDIDAAVMHDASVDVDALVKDAGSSTDDVDGDGFTDNVDNCPTIANVDQHDEDGDSRGDVCDPCPHLAGNSSDIDGDGVGDACDPEPLISRQRLTFFDPFTSQRSEWAITGGTVGLDRLTFVGTAQAAFANVAVDHANVRIACGGRIDGIQPGVEHQFAVRFNTIVAPFAPSHYVMAYDHPSGSSQGVYIMESLSSQFGPLASQAYSPPLPTGAWSFVIDASASTRAIAFTPKIGGTTMNPMSGTAAQGTLIPASLIGVVVVNARVEFDYLVVIETDFEP